MTRSLTIERTTILILFMLLFALATRIQADTDMWWHLRLGQYITENRVIPLTDQFSHTFFGQPRRPSEWGAQVILYAVWSMAGDIGMALVTAALATGGMIVLFQSMEGNTYLRAFAAILGAATAAVFWSARPQMFSFFLSAVIVYVIYLYKRRQIDRLWLIPLIMLAWAQLHGGWAIGFIILGGTIAGEILNNLLKSQSEHIIDWRQGTRLVIFTALGALALLANPSGLNLLTLPFETVSIGPLQQYIQEWNAPNFAAPEVWPFLFLLVLTVIAILSNWRKLDWTEVIVLGAAGLLAVRAGRNISFFAVVATPVLTYHLAAWMQRRGWVLNPVKRPTRLMVRLNVFLIAMVALGCIAKVLLVADAETVNEAKALTLPIKAVEYIEANRPPGPMFNSYNWGGYLMFAAPDYPVYVDGRTDLYKDFVFEFVKIWSAGEGWQEALAENNLVLTETKSILAQTLRQTPGWSLAYEDDLATVFVREDPA